MGILTVSSPSEFEYLTDGRRLVMFLYIDEKGCFVVEDAVTDETIVLAPGEGPTWRSVKRGRRG